MCGLYSLLSLLCVRCACKMRVNLSLARHFELRASMHFYYGDRLNCSILYSTGTNPFVSSDRKLTILNPWVCCRKTRWSDFHPCRVQIRSLSPAGRGYQAPGTLQRKEAVAGVTWLFACPMKRQRLSSNDRARSTSAQWIMVVAILWWSYCVCVFLLCRYAIVA